MNKSLVQYWQSLSGKFENLTHRERLMVLVALLAVVYALINSLFINPISTQQKILKGEIDTNQAQISALQQQISTYAGSPIIDPDAGNKARIAELQTQIEKTETQLNALQTTLVSPEKMPALLRSILKSDGKLKLIALNSLEAKHVLDKPVETSVNTVASGNSEQTGQQKPKSVNEQDLPLFKHGVEITLEGNYLDLLHYVSSIESMPWHVLWSRAEFTSKAYPVSQLKLTVYTLSLDQVWLSI